MIAYQELTEKQQKRYDRILLQAQELMYEQGFYKLSLSELTNVLKISRSTIYENFGSKEGLAEKVIERLSKQLDEGLNSVVNNAELTTYEKFILVAQNQGENLDINCYRLLNDLKVHLPHVYHQFEEGRKKRESNGYALLVDMGIKEGVFDLSLSKDFLLQLYLKMGQLISDTNMLEHLSMTKAEAMKAIINVYLKGTKN